MKKVLIVASVIISSLFTSVIAYASPGTSSVTTISGKDCYELANNISQKGWTSSDTVILASSSDFPDALAGTALAINLNAPILFTAPDHLDNTTLSEMKRVKAKTVYILGGTGSVSSTVEDTITANDMSVNRLGGQDRYSTSRVIGQELINKTNSDTVFLCNANNYPDALSGSTFAGQTGSPILLTGGKGLDEETLKKITDWKIKKIYILGGTGVIDSSVENMLKNMNINVVRLGGTDRYDTSMKIVKNFDTSLDKFTLVTGKGYHNALASSVYASKTSHPLLLIDNDSNSSIKALVKDKDLIMVGSELTENGILYGDALNRVKPSIVYGTMNRNSGNFASGETVQILMDTGNGASYEVATSDRTGWISGSSVSIPSEPSTNADRLSQEEMEYYVNTQGFSSDTSYFIWVDIDRQLVNVFNGSKGNWQLVNSCSCASGTNHTPTKRGTFAIQSKGLSFGSYEELGAKYYSAFSGNYMIHSVPYQYGEIADYTLGQRASHGCLRVSVDNAEWIYEYVPIGTAVWSN